MLEAMGFNDGEIHTSAHDDLVGYIIEHREELFFKHFPRAASKIIKFELERPVTKQGGYIVGYIDIMLIGDIFAENQKYGEYYEKKVLAIEVKTKIQSIGEILRQINTYREYTCGYESCKRFHWAVAAPFIPHAEMLVAEKILPIITEN